MYARIHIYVCDYVYTNVFHIHTCIYSTGSIPLVNTDNTDFSTKKWGVAVTNTEHGKVALELGSGQRAQEF